MTNADINWIANYIWGICDDVLRDLYTRGKFRDVVLPMTVLRRLDVVLEDTKQAVLDMKEMLDQAGVVDQDAASAKRRDRLSTTPRSSRRAISGARASQAQLKADFEACPRRVSPNVQEILDNFEFRNHIPRHTKGNACVVRPDLART